MGKWVYGEGKCEDKSREKEKKKRKKKLEKLLNFLNHSMLIFGKK